MLHDDSDTEVPQLCKASTREQSDDWSFSRPLVPQTRSLFMKASVFFALTLIATGAFAEQSLGGASASLSGTSAGSPQTAGPLNSAPNGAGGTYGYPNNPVDPNTSNPGLPQQPYYGGPYYNSGGGTTSGTTTAPNSNGAPFVTPPTTTATSPSASSPSTSSSSSTSPSTYQSNGLTPSSSSGSSTR